MPGLINPSDRIFVAGHRGMAGSAICRALERAGYSNLLTASREQLNLENPLAVHGWFETMRPDVVVMAAAKVGGIHANNVYRADFLYDNLMIEANLIHAAHEVGVEKLLFLGSSCIYPKLAEQPIREDALMTAPLEPTNQWYAVAKIAGVYLCQAYRQQHGLSCVPWAIAIAGDAQVGEGGSRGVQARAQPAGVSAIGQRQGVFDGDKVLVVHGQLPRRCRRRQHNVEAGMRNNPASISIFS